MLRRLPGNDRVSGCRPFFISHSSAESVSHNGCGAKSAAANSVARFDALAFARTSSSTADSNSDTDSDSNSNAGSDSESNADTASDPDSSANSRSSCDADTESFRAGAE